MDFLLPAAATAFAVGAFPFTLADTAKAVFFRECAVLVFALAGESEKSKSSSVSSSTLATISFLELLFFFFEAEAARGAEAKPERAEIVELVTLISTLFGTDTGVAFDFLELPLLGVDLRFFAGEAGDGGLPSSCVPFGSAGEGNSS